MADKRTSIDILVALRDKVSGPLTGIKNKLDETRRKTEALRGAFDKVAGAGKKLAAVGLAIVAAFALAGNSYAQTEAGLLKVRTAMTGTPAEVGLKYAEAMAAARHWTNRHINSLEDWAESAYRMEAIGLQGQRMIEGTNTALLFATATFGDAATAGNLLAGVYENFGDKTKAVKGEMGRLADQLTATQQNFLIADLNQLAEGFKGAAGAANSMGVETAQTLTALGYLNTKFAQGAEAGTLYAATVSRMGRASKALGFETVKNTKGGLDYVATLAAMRDKLGHSSEWTQKLRDKMTTAFGEDVAAKISLLTDNVGQLGEKVAAVTDSAGLTGRAAELIEGGIGATFRKLKNNLRNLLEVGFQPLAEDVGKLAESIGSLATRLGAFAEEHPSLVKMVSLLLALAGAGLIVGGGLLWLAGTLAGAATNLLGFAAAIGPMLAPLAGLGAALGPIAIVIGALAILILYLIYFDEAVSLMKKVPTYAIYLIRLINPFAALLMAIAKVWPALEKFWDKLKALWADTNWANAAGRALIAAFAQGITGAVGVAVAAVRTVLTRVQGFFNQSDAKEGPLSNLTWQGSMLPTTLARGVRAGASNLIAAVDEMAFTLIPGLDFAAAGPAAAAPATRAAAPAFRGGNRVGSIHVHFNGGGPASQRDIEQGVEAALRRMSYEVGG